MSSAALRFSIYDLYASYSSCLDNYLFNEWPDFFTEDCLYQVIPRENYDSDYPLATISLEGQGMLKDRVYGITETLYHAPYYQRHIVSIPLINLSDKNKIMVDANYLVVRTKMNQPSEIMNAGRYIDQIKLTDSGLKFSVKRCVFDSELIPNSLIYPI